jgi:hypothetical protein
VVRDLNNEWSARCLGWLRTGLDALDDAQISASHVASRDALRNFLEKYGSDPTVGGILILDAVTVHDSEMNRISRTLR